MATPLSASLAFALCLVTAPGVLWFLRRAQVVDVPSPRSSHAEPTPRGGGIAPAIGCLVAAMAVPTALSGKSRAALLFLGCGMGMVGLIDDVERLDPVLCLLGQAAVAAAGLMWLGQDIAGPAIWQLVFSIGLVVWVVGYVNAFNFMDGINGISVVQVVIAAAVWWVLGRTQGVAALAVAALIVGAAAAAFAPFNTPRARMFLGDVGSYFFGAWLAATAVIGLRAGIPPEAVLAPLSLYGADTMVTLFRRVHRGDRWFEPHREHTYQRLVQAGWSHTQTALLVGLVSAAASAAGALSLTHSLVARGLGDVLVVGVLVTYLALPGVLLRRETYVAQPRA